MPARKARGAIVEKGEEGRKVIGDYLNNPPTTTQQMGERACVGVGLARDAGTSVYQ